MSIPTERSLLALGDCNTLGTVELEPFAYPVLLGPMLGVQTINCGHTMCTVREGWEYAVRRLNASTAYLTVQFGLVDSWLTFRGAPYVLNYPENPTRLFLRKSVKKFKKLARQMGVHRWLGEVSVVPPSEYQARLTAIVRLARERSPGVHICLIATPPSLIADRNSRIEDYNAMLKQVGMDHHCAFVDGYALFRDRSELFLDPVHLNKDAHAMLAQSCLEALRLG